MSPKRRCLDKKKEAEQRLLGCCWLVNDKEYLLPEELAQVNTQAEAN